MGGFAFHGRLLQFERVTSCFGERIGKMEKDIGKLGGRIMMLKYKARGCCVIRRRESALRQKSRLNMWGGQGQDLILQAPAEGVSFWLGS